MICMYTCVHESSYTDVQMHVHVYMHACMQMYTWMCRYMPETEVGSSSAHYRIKAKSVPKVGPAGPEGFRLKGTTRQGQRGSPQDTHQTTPVSYVLWDPGEAGAGGLWGCHDTAST